MPNQTPDHRAELEQMTGLPFDMAVSYLQMLHKSKADQTEHAFRDYLTEHAGITPQQYNTAWHEASLQIMSHIATCRVPAGEDPEQWDRTLDQLYGYLRLGWMIHTYRDHLEGFATHTREDPR